MLTNSNSRSIINSIISLGKSLGKTIIAEGIKTLEQKEYLTEEGCDQMQGYYFSPPLPGEKALEKLKK